MRLSPLTERNLVIKAAVEHARRVHGISVEALAAALGCTRSVMRRRLSDEHPEAGFRFEAIEKLVDLLPGLAEALGFTRTVRAHGQAEPVPLAFSRLCREAGELQAKVAEAIADGSLTPSELAGIEQEGRQLGREIEATVDAARAMAAALPQIRVNRG